MKCWLVVKKFVNLIVNYELNVCIGIFEGVKITPRGSGLIITQDTIGERRKKKVKRYLQLRGRNNANFFEGTGDRVSPRVRNRPSLIKVALSGSKKK